MYLRRTEADFRAKLEQANHDLAEAAAADRGWDRETLEGAARRIYAEQRGAEPSELLLVEVLDRPGTDEDLAVFHVEGEGRRATLTLGRRDGEWVLDSLGRPLRRAARRGAVLDVLDDLDHALGVVADRDRVEVGLADVAVGEHRARSQETRPLQ